MELYNRAEVAACRLQVLEKQLAEVSGEELVKLAPTLLSFSTSDPDRETRLQHEVRDLLSWHQYDVFFAAWMLPHLPNKDLPTQASFDQQTTSSLIKFDIKHIRRTMHLPEHDIWPYDNMIGAFERMLNSLSQASMLERRIMLCLHAFQHKLPLDLRNWLQRLVRSRILDDKAAPYMPYLGCGNRLSDNDIDMNVLADQLVKEIGDFHQKDNRYIKAFAKVIYVLLSNGFAWQTEPYGSGYLCLHPCLPYLLRGAIRDIHGHSAWLFLASSTTSFVDMYTQIYASGATQNSVVEDPDHKNEEYFERKLHTISEDAINIRSAIGYRATTFIPDRNSIIRAFGLLRLHPQSPVDLRVWTRAIETTIEGYLIGMAGSWQTRSDVSKSCKTAVLEDVLMLLVLQIDLLHWSGNSVGGRRIGLDTIARQGIDLFYMIGVAEPSHDAKTLVMILNCVLYSSMPKDFLESDPAEIQELFAWVPPKRGMPYWVTYLFWQEMLSTARSGRCMDLGLIQTISEDASLCSNPHVSAKLNPLVTQLKLRKQNRGGAPLTRHDLADLQLSFEDDSRALQIRYIQLGSAMLEGWAAGRRDPNTIAERRRDGLALAMDAEREGRLLLQYQVYVVLFDDASNDHDYESAAKHHDKLIALKSCVPSSMSSLIDRPHTNDMSYRRCINLASLLLDNEDLATPGSRSEQLRQAKTYLLHAFVDLDQPVCVDNVNLDVCLFMLVKVEYRRGRPISAQVYDCLRCVREVNLSAFTVVATDCLIDLCRLRLLPPHGDQLDWQSEVEDAEIDLAHVSGRTRREVAQYIIGIESLVSVSIVELGLRSPQNGMLGLVVMVAASLFAERVHPGSQHAIYLEEGRLFIPKDVMENVAIMDGNKDVPMNVV